jgi:hypothetical protein
VVYGPKYAEALRDIFPGTLIMYGHTNATCSNKHPTSATWPPAAASHTSPTREAARKPSQFGPPSTGKTSCRRTEKKPNCYAAAQPANGSTSQTGATSYLSGIALSRNAFANCQPKYERAREGIVTHIEGCFGWLLSRG